MLYMAFLGVLMQRLHDRITNVVFRPGAGGSCISVGDAVAGWKEHIQPLKGLKDAMYLGSPAVSNAAASDTTGLGWLAKFIEACSGCTIDFINIHWYVRQFRKHHLKLQPSPALVLDILSYMQN